MCTSDTREIHVDAITETIEKLCIDSNYYLSEDINDALKDGLGKEESETGRYVLENLIINAELAKNNNMAICQDCGMVVIFIEIGQEVTLVGGSINNAVNEGVRRGYKKGCLRKSIVKDPLHRTNTGDNTPAIIHYDLVPGDKIKISVMPKGFGSENMSALKMLKPSDGIEGVKKFIVDTVEAAGPNPCPPIIVGVGIGGTMEKAALLAKKALLRPIYLRNNNIKYKELEEELINIINKTGIGPQGLGGILTALAVNIEYYSTHIAGLPVAVNIGCHVNRHASYTIWKCKNIYY